MVFKKGTKNKNWNGFKKGHKPTKGTLGMKFPQQSERMKGNNYGIKNKGKKYSDEINKKKGRIGNTNGFKKGHHYNIGVIRNEQWKEKRRVIVSNKLLKDGQLKFGTHEKQILDELELSIGYKIIRQYAIKGYFLDGYIPELNLVIEIDEEHHKRQKEKDKERENNIKKELNCKFIRIDDNF
jgi:very-short-patch-repair endonuclease